MAIDAGASGILMGKHCSALRGKDLLIFFPLLIGLPPLIVAGSAAFLSFDRLIKMMDWVGSMMPIEYDI